MTRFCYSILRLYALGHCNSTHRRWQKYQLTFNVRIGNDRKRNFRYKYNDRRCCYCILHLYASWHCYDNEKITTNFHCTQHDKNSNFLQLYIQTQKMLLLYSEIYTPQVALVKQINRQSMWYCITLVLITRHFLCA